MDSTFRLESRQLSPEQEAEELVRYLKEDPKWKRLDFYFSTHLTLMEPAFFWDSQNRGGVDINPPCYLCPGASGRLVLNMTIVGYPLKIFLRYITFL